MLPNEPEIETLPPLSLTLEAESHSNPLWINQLWTESTAEQFNKPPRKSELEAVL